MTEEAEKEIRELGDSENKPTRPTPRDIVPGLLNLVLRVEDLNFKQRHELLKSLELVLNEWVELTELVVDMSGPKEAPSANP